MRYSQIQDRVKVLELVMKKVHGAGVDRTWHFVVKDPLCHLYHGFRRVAAPDVISYCNRKVLRIKNSYHCMDEHGGYCGWAAFSVVFPMGNSLDEYRIEFHGSESQRLQRKYDIREYLDQLIIDAIHSAQAEILISEMEKV